VKIHPAVSLAVIVGILATGVAASAAKARRTQPGKAVPAKEEPGLAA
jgi:hypothetical protein